MHLQVHALQHRHVEPAFVDIDADGDLDALIGNDAGDVVFYRNNAGSTVPSGVPRDVFTITTSDGAGGFDTSELRIAAIAASQDGMF